MGCQKNNPPDISNTIKIDSISPTQGLPNDTIIIKGVNFNANASDNLVKFNNDLATIILVSKDSLIVIAPLNGTTGPVTVTAGGNTATGPVFTYLDSVDVYAAVRGDGVIYWKNDEEFFLSPVQNNTGGAFAITKSGSDVFVAGYGNRVPGIWKNGVETVLPVFSTVVGGTAKAMAISGNDIYIGGSDGSTPVYWKNGVENTLPPIVNGFGFVNAIAVKGNDIYAAGYASNSIGELLLFWKNGVETILGTKGIVEIGATSIALSGSDVYVCGTDSGNAAYWKNGVKVSLPKSSDLAYANAIAVSGNDVYVVGDDGGDAVYWKNEIRFLLPYASYAGSGTSITIYQSDVYIGGEDGMNTVYWKNGIEHHLPGGNGSSGYITSMVVTKP